MKTIRDMTLRVACICLFGACGLAGVFAAMGFCAAVWGPAVLETALGSPPDRSHPAFWVGLSLMVPLTIIGFAGAFFSVVLPVYDRFGVRSFTVKDRKEVISIATWYRDMLTRTIERNQEPNQASQGIPRKLGNPEG